MPKIVFHQTDRSPQHHPFRESYLEQLNEAQELFLELQIQKGVLHEIWYNDTLAGYAVTDVTGRLLEFHVVPTAVNVADMLFETLIEQLSIKNAYVKSFDAQVLACAAKHHKKLSVAGYLYRHRSIAVEAPLQGDIQARPAVAADTSMIAAVNEDVFEAAHEIDDYIAKKQIHLFVRKDDLFGFAIHARVIENRPEYDVGMLVASPYRRMGLGKVFLAFAADHVRKLGGRPTMGCDAENIPSQRTIQSLGYISKYRMLEFTF